MTGLPDIVIILDQQEEYTALRECITLGIPTICLIDTNCDPDLSDISIPANDDAIASIRLILNKLHSVRLFRLKIQLAQDFKNKNTIDHNEKHEVLE